MNAYDRFRVKGAKQTFTDKGPDLLREHGNALARVRTMLGQGREGWTFRTENAAGVKTDESKKLSKAAVVERLERWLKNPAGQEIIILHHGEPEVVIRYAPVRKLAMVNCSPGTVLLHSLLHEQFPKIRFAGGYVYKLTSPGYWSDHAWGTADDETENPPEPMNDETMDWLSRMGKARCLEFDYALGSRNGNVVQCGAPDYDIEPSGASDSHLWHNHISIVDHDGRKPPREGGVW